MSKNKSNLTTSNRLIIEGSAAGNTLVCSEGLSFWGGVDPQSGIIIDAHHPNHGDCISGKCLLMPTSRGSCSGSGVLLELALKGLGPAAIIFHEPEQVLTLGAMVCDRIFGVKIPIIYLKKEDYLEVASATNMTLANQQILIEDKIIDLTPVNINRLTLSEQDQSFLSGDHGAAAQSAMETICLMAAVENTDQLVSVRKGHIDGCILAHEANLIFAEKMAALGAKVNIPTTINAISVDREHWRGSGLPTAFGEKASRLADAYVQMGVKPTFTCAPYLLDDAPQFGEKIGWSESNAVIYANTVIGAQTQKHPDYLDLFIAITGRAPATGVYSTAGRKAKILLEINVPSQWSTDDEVLWPLVGWLAGKYAPDQIPLIIGLENLRPTPDDLKALCAAFGTTSGAPMLHIRGHTPESEDQNNGDLPIKVITQKDLLEAWNELNRGLSKIDLVAIGSPHASIEEIRKLSALMDGKKCQADTKFIITTGRNTLAIAKEDGHVAALEDAGVTLMPDLCWCSIIEPIFPSAAKGLMTNSGKYAHYAHGLSGRHSRLGSLSECVDAAITGSAPLDPPGWLIKV
jgi:predicted aconitase/predicted aconitase with swiveling domain